MPQPNWFDAGNAILGAGTGLLGGIDKLQKDKQARALGLLQAGYQEDADGNLTKTEEQRKKEAFDQADKQAGILKSGFQGKYNPETHEVELGKIPGFKDIEQQMKQLQMQKLKQEIEQGPKPSDQQANAALFGRKAQEAEQDLEDLEKTGYDPTSLGSKIKGLPVIGTGLGLLHSVGIGGKYTDVEPTRLYDQAKSNFKSATLRRESGAAISKSEDTAADKQYFGQTGESQKVRDQKARNRQLSTQGILAAAGPRALRNLPEPTRASSAGSPNRGGGLIGNAVAAPPPVFHTKESLSQLSDDELRAMAGK